MTILSASVVAFLVTTTLMLALRPAAVALSLVDRPGGRKTHSGQIPVIGGLAMFGGLLVAAFAGGELGHDGTAVLVAAAMMVFVGALDDRFDIKPVARLLAHLAAAVALAFGTKSTVTSLGDLLGLGEITLGWMALPFTLIACIALINAFNMLDGLDGLAGGTALIAFGGLALSAIAAGASAPSVMAMSLVGAITGFLMFNLPTRYNRTVRSFMGDAGSTLLGFMLACVALILVERDTANLQPVVVLWMMPIPIYELFTSTGRRLMHGRSPMQADSGHFHHRLLRAGFSVRLIFTVYIVVSLLAAMIGLSASRQGVSEPVLFVGFVAGYAVWLLFIRYSKAISTYLPGRFRRELENLRY